MSKVVQFRCPDCGRLLIKYEKGKTVCMYKAEGLQFIEPEEGKRAGVICTKCNTRLEIAKDGLRKVEAVPVIPRPVKNIAALV